MINIAIFVSGSGSNCENLIRYFDGHQSIRPVVVVSNRSDAYALVPMMERYKVDWIVLAGFLPLIPEYLIDRFPRRIVNLHPALLPKFGGKGMWGHHVHEAVKAAGETETGMTVHYVSPICDGGDIIAQFRVAVSPEDTVDDIAEKEHQLEMKYLPGVIEELIVKR